MEFTEQFLTDTAEIVRRLDRGAVAAVVRLIAETQVAGGRIFFLGCGGGAGHASHAVNDFRLLAGIPSFTPTDNVSELTARINDDGWDTAFSNWLKGSRLSEKDGVFVFSVGGGNKEKNISVNIVNGVKLAKEVGAKVFGVVGRDGGYTARVADACVIIPMITEGNVTPHTEACQAVVWHLIVSHPDLRASEMKWESVE